jgi:hypothetical protein
VEDNFITLPTAQLNEDYHAHAMAPAGDYEPEAYTPLWKTCPICDGVANDDCPRCGGLGGHYSTVPVDWSSTVRTADNDATAATAATAAPTHPDINFDDDEYVYGELLTVIEQEELEKLHSHWPGCYAYGPQHYKCALAEITRLHEIIASMKKVLVAVP